MRELSCNIQTVMYILQCRIYLLQYCRKPGRDFSFRLNKQFFLTKKHKHWLILFHWYKVLTNLLRCCLSDWNIFLAVNYYFKRNMLLIYLKHSHKKDICFLWLCLKLTSNKLLRKRFKQFICNNQEMKEANLFIFFKKITTVYTM